VKSEGWNGDLA